MFAITVCIWYEDRQFVAAGMGNDKNDAFSTIDQNAIYQFLMETHMPKNWFDELENIYLDDDLADLLKHAKKGGWEIEILENEF